MPCYCLNARVCTLAYRPHTELLAHMYSINSSHAPPHPAPTYPDVSVFLLRCSLACLLRRLQPVPGNIKHKCAPCEPALGMRVWRGPGGGGGMSTGQTARRRRRHRNRRQQPHQQLDARLCVAQTAQTTVTDFATNWKFNSAYACMRVHRAGLHACSILKIRKPSVRAPRAPCLSFSLSFALPPHVVSLATTPVYNRVYKYINVLCWNAAEPNCGTATQMQTRTHRPKIYMHHQRESIINIFHTHTRTSTPAKATHNAPRWP